jgi:hypothetical protein
MEMPSAWPLVWFSINWGTSRKIQAAREMEPRMPLRASVVVRGMDGWCMAVVKRVEGCILVGGLGDGAPFGVGCGIGRKEYESVVLLPLPGLRAQGRKSTQH